MQAGRASMLTELTLRLIKVNRLLYRWLGAYICIMNGFPARILPILLVITILVVTGFQLFWLKQSYDSEKRTMEVRTGINFRESVFNLQAKQLSSRFGLPINAKDSFQIEIHEGGIQDKLVRYNKTREVISMINVQHKRDLENEMADPTNKNTAVTIVADNGPQIFYGDSLKQINTVYNNEKSGYRFIKLLNGIDSAVDTLKVTDIRLTTAASFAKEGLKVPFDILKLAAIKEEQMPPPLDEITVGFSKPVTYKLVLGNSFPYLFRRLLSPLLFSLFLIGVTMASFILLYRNLLQQKRLATLKNDFISNVTHELKTPIATVNVALEAMKNFNAINDPVKTREYLEISQGELQRLSLLVDKVLRISMFENNEIQLNIEEVDLLALVKEVSVSMRLQFEKRSAAVNVKTNGSSFIVNGDRLHLMSVVYNLFDNALKYSGESPEINVSLSGKGDAVEVIFADNGTGIPSAYREKVFEKFFRVPHGDTHNVKGYGLGLSYVSQIIKQHNGTIQVESEEDNGSRFLILIPTGDGRS